MKTYGNLVRRKGRWTLSGTQPHLAIRLKHLFPRISATAVAPFDFPDDPHHCADLAWFCQRYPMQITPADERSLRRGAKAYERSQDELHKIFSDESPVLRLRPAGLVEGQVIRPYQGQAVAVAYRRTSLLLGDDLGLGKTYTAAALLLEPGTLPAAVVIQPHLQDQWEEKLQAFTTLRVHKIKGTRPYPLPPADVYLFRYSQIAGWVDVLATGTFKTAVFDEIQELRTGTASDKGSAARELAGAVKWRLGLSATPIYNYGAEIWNIFNTALDREVLGTWAEFQREWMADDKRLRDPAALGAYLRDQFVFMRRTKKDVGQQCPPINRLVETIESDPQALADVDKLARQLAIRTTTGSFVERGQAGRELDLLVRQATGVGKAKNVAAYVRILLANGERVMLAGWHRECYDIWLRELAEFKPAMYTGSESPTQKAESKRRFMERETNLFIISLRSGAGLDGLQQSCSTVVFGELDWSPKVHDQVIGRLDREGQTEQVTAVYLNSNDGSDPPMVELLGVKASQAHGVTDLGVALDDPHSDSSRIQRLAERYLRMVKRTTPSATPEAPDAVPEAA